MMFFFANLATNQCLVFTTPTVFISVEASSSHVCICAAVKCCVHAGECVYSLLLCNARRGLARFYVN